MAKHIAIKRPDGTISFVRSEVETGSENPLTHHEQIINELFTELNKHKPSQYDN